MLRLLNYLEKAKLQDFSQLSFLFVKTQKENQETECGFTNKINWDSPIAEAASGLKSVEISAVRRAVCTCKSAEEVVGAAVDGRISDYKQCRNQRKRISWGFCW